jgi:hypothetical protein
VRIIDIRPGMMAFDVVACAGACSTVDRRNTCALMFGAGGKVAEATLRVQQGEANPHTTVTEVRQRFFLTSPNQS